MGIGGLLPFLKPSSTEKHIKDFKGQTAAIDSYCWLHKGAFGCADKLAMGEKTDGYISYCFKYIDMLLTFKIKPILVLDGQHLPAKLLTEKKRRESRNQARKRATECLKLGNMAEARNNFKRCVDITPEMAFELIKECRKRNIDCIVAPYEADAQLAYLNQSKLADFVISEDSDLLTFGCSKVLFKLDLTGRGTLVESDKLHLATKDRPDTFSFDKFRYMCILSGCDYLDSLPGIGLKKALKFIKSMPNDDIYNNMVKIPKVLNMPSLIVTKEYRDQFMIADATFRHQLVFDVVLKKLVPLTDPEKCGTNLEHCCNSGKMLDSNLAYQIAVGNFNPFTHKELSNWSPQQSNFSSIWCRSSYTKSKPVSHYTNTNNILKIETTPSKIKKEIIAKQDEPIDDQIEQKLVMMYSIKKTEQKIDNSEEPPAKKICIRQENQEKSPSPKKRNSSPILSGKKQFINPFLKKKLLNSVETKEKTVVSKYFSSETSEENIETDDSPTLHTITNDCSRINNIKIENSIANIKDNSVTEIKTKDSSTVTNIKEVKTNSEEVNSDSEEELPNSLKENEISPNIQVENFPIVGSSNTQITNVEIISKKIEVKPQNLTKCRPQGLLKNNNKNNNKFKPNKNQPTLLSMFAFSKK